MKKTKTKRSVHSSDDDASGQHGDSAAGAPAVTEINPTAGPSSDGATPPANDPPPAPDAPPDDSTQEPAPRISGEVQPCVDSAASVISGCTDSEVKNYMATADFVCRQLAVKLADMWPGICATAQKNGKENEKAAKVSLSAKIDVDHTNILFMDTKLTVSYSNKVSESSETQEDLRQTEFALRN